MRKSSRPPMTASRRTVAPSISNREGDSSLSEKSSTPPLESSGIPPRRGATPPRKSFGNDKKSNALTVVLIILTLAFLGAAVVFMKQKMDVEERLTKEKEELVGKFKALKMQLDEVSSQNTIYKDSLAKQSGVITSYIDSLNKSRNYAKSLVRYKHLYFTSIKQTKAMLKINDSLVQTIQSLTDQKNKLLEQLKGQMVSNDTLKERLAIISKELEKFAKDVSSGKTPRKVSTTTSSSSDLLVGSITVKPVGKKRGKEISAPIKKATKLKVCFNVGETDAIGPSNVAFLIRVEDPKGNIVGGNKNAKTSTSKSLYYANKSMDVCAYVNRTKKFKKGSYTVSVMDENMNVLSSRDVSLE